MEKIKRQIKDQRRNSAELRELIIFIFDLLKETEITEYITALAKIRNKEI